MNGHQFIILMEQNSHSSEEESNQVEILELKNKNKKLKYKINWIKWCIHKTF